MRCVSGHVASKYFVVADGPHLNWMRVVDKQAVA